MARNMKGSTAKNGNLFNSDFKNNNVKNSNAYNSNANNNNIPVNKELKKQLSNKSYKYHKEADDNVKNYFIIPIILIIVILPLIVRLKYYNPNMSQYPWFGANTSQADYFLFYKQKFTIWMTVIMTLIIVLKAYFKRASLRFAPEFIPLSIYALLVIGSAVFSKYASYSFSGGFEQFESVFALLGYCIITYYSFLFISSERDIKVLINMIITAALIMSFIGILQFTGHDLFGSEFGLDLILPDKFRKGASLILNFGKNRVYLSLYNPNYVGVYTALIIPILIVIALFNKNIIIKGLSIIATIGLTICLIGSQSLAGLVSMAVAVFFILLFAWRYLLKRIYITIPVIALLVISLFILNIQTDRLLENKLLNMFEYQGPIYKTTAMATNDDNISITYDGNQLFVQYVLNDNLTATILPYDGEYKQVAGTYDAATNTIQLTDERFIGITIGMGSTSGIFYISCEGLQFNFTNQTDDGTYYYINSKGILDKMITAPSAVFTGHESFASNRGYIWSRTIPLIKNYILLGSGPDTYTLVYPQNDYLKMAQCGFTDIVLTKPHSMFLQMSIETGLLSLIAFLTFYAIYFVSSMVLYIKGIFNSVYSKIGFAIFVGTISYMISAISNDSSITTAPVFWALIGTGISVNRKAKPMIIAKANEYRIKKTELKSEKGQLESEDNNDI